MPIPTVEEICTDAAALLGDPAQDVYTLAVQLPFFRIAWGELWDAMANNGVQAVERETAYTLPANTTSLTPATASISHMGEPVKLWERLNGSTAKYDEMDQVEELSQRDAAAALREWKWEGDTFYFIGSTEARQLKIEYRVSSNPPASGATALDGCRSFLAVRTASIIAPSRGMPGLGQTLAMQALGPRLQPDASGGLLHQFINQQVKRILPTQIPRFRQRRPHW